MLNLMVQDHDSSYVAFVRAQSARTRKAMLEIPLPTAVEAHFRDLARQSIEEQERIEATDTVPFETYRQQYLSPDRLRSGSA